MSRRALGKEQAFPCRLRVVSNFGDGDCGAGEIHIRARTKFRGDVTLIFGAPFLIRVASPRNFARARVCISPAPQSPSPKLETTRSLVSVGFQSKKKKKKIKDRDFRCFSPSLIFCSRPIFRETKTPKIPFFGLPHGNACYAG